MTIKSAAGSVCERCTITITPGGRATAVYRWEGYRVDESDSLDDDVTGWSDADVREVMSEMIGVSEGLDEIEVVWQ